VVQLSLMSVALASKTFMPWAFKKTLQTSNIKNQGFKNYQ